MQNQKSLLIAALVLPACLLYLFLIPANHTEAEDAFKYALEVETGPIWETAHPFHLLYLPAARGLFLLTGLPRAYPMLVGMSKVLALATLAVFGLFLSRRMGLSTPAAALGVAMLGSSYGFWRYANEAEVYLPASFAAIALAWVAFSPERHRRPALVAILAAGAFSIHIFNAGLALVAIPWRYVAEREYRPLIRYLATFAALIIPLYILAYTNTPVEDLDDSLTSYASGGYGDFFRISFENIPKGIPGLIQSLVSGNFLLGYPPFARLLVQTFPARMMGEELFMGQQQAPWILYAGALTLLGTAVLSGALLLGRIRVSLSLPLEDRKDVWAVSLWLSVPTAVALRFGSGNPENWILALIPLWILLMKLGLAPVMAKKPAAVWTLAAFFFLHNLVAGILVVMDREGDYNYARSVWLAENTTVQDVILTQDNQVLSRYLAYHLPARVINLFKEKDHNWGAINHTLDDSPGRVYALEEVFNPPEYMSFLPERYWERAWRYGQVIQGEYRLVHEHPLGDVYLRRR